MNAESWPSRVASGASRFVEVAVDVPVRSTFHYVWGAPLGELPAPGARVAVPFGRSRRVGYFLREVPEEEARSAVGGRALREVAYAIDRESLFTPGVLELARWISRRYFAGLGEVLSAALPGGVREDTRAARVKVLRATASRERLLEEAARLEAGSPDAAAALRALAERGELRLGGPGGPGAGLARRLVRAGLAAIDEVPRAETFAPPRGTRSPEFELTREQAGALGKIRALRESAARGEGPFGLLLEGVTGSGKTEVYLRAIAEAVAGGAQAVVLVPEIALTPQTISRFAERFRRIAVLHSGLSDGARADEWRRIRSGGADVVIGARSAVFAPVARLGLIVVDEEHEPSYKQESSPRYHARDAALERARIERAIAVLGSATPSLESYLAARRPESLPEGSRPLAHAVLSERIGSRPLPPVEVVDMRRERLRTRGYPVLSRPLAEALANCLRRGEQAIVFLNRRGFSTFLHCPRCGTDVKCAKCDVPLVLHKSPRRSANGPARTGAASGEGAPPARGELRCHYCGAASEVPASCPYCGFGKLLALGTGTERVVEAVLEAAPSARVVRMDADAMARREDYERALEEFGSGRADVLVGTQMVAKGLDLPRVTLVGVVNADVALSLPDFRSSERAFQLVAQVAGRAGRSELGGRVIVQTGLPESLAIRAGSRHDMAAFAAEELEHRRLFAYPPYTRLARIVVEGPREEAVDRKIGAIAEALRPSGPDCGWSLLGPAISPLGRLRGRKRQHLLVKAAGASVLEDLLWRSARVLQGTGATRVVVDVDPVSMR